MKKFFKFAAFLMAFSMTATFTACGDDEEDEVTERVSLSNLTAKAQGDGTVIFTGTIESNAKIKTFEIQDAKGNQVEDLFEKNAQVKEKGEDGKTFTLSITSDQVDIDQALYIVAKTKGDKEAKSQLTAAYDFKIGDSESEIGSYISFKNETTYKLAEAKEAANVGNVDAVVTVNEDSSWSLKIGSEAKSADIAAGAAKAYIGETTTGNGAVITSNDLIASFHIYDVNGHDGNVKGYILSSTYVTGLSVDVSGVTLK